MIGSDQKRKADQIRYEEVGGTGHEDSDRTSVAKYGYISQLGRKYYRLNDK